MSDLHVYDYEVDLLSDTAPARVIRMAGRNKRVLEIGAGPGSITRHLSATNECDVVAADIDPAALKMLTPHARAVYDLDLDDPGWPRMLEHEGKFDVVIAADVLEHLYDPAAVLRAMVPLLAEGGSIILSLPHVAHCTVHACMLLENFEYRDWGLLDRTHIRFFGLRNIEALHAQAGLAITEAEFVVRRPEQTEFREQWEALPRRVRRALETNRHGYVYQCVSRARPVAQVSNPVSLLDLPVEVPPAELKLFGLVDAMAKLMQSAPPPLLPLRARVGRALRARGLRR